MPVACIPLEETNRTILSAAYFSIIQDVIRRINIPYGTLIAMHKGMEINRTDNFSNMTTEQRANLPSTVSERKVIVTVNENYNEDALTTTAVSYKDTAPIFVDPTIDASVYPVYVTSDVTLEIKFTTPSKTEAQRLRDDLRIKLSQMRNIEHHAVEYDILLPEIVSDFIADLHQLKSRLHPSELSEYFRTFSTKRVHLITDTARLDNAAIAVRERQGRIVGVFDFNPMPDVVEEDVDQNTYRLTVPYKMTLEVPRAMCIDYPPTVCNRPMPSKYLKWIQDAKVKSREESVRNRTYTQSLSVLSHFEAHRQLEYRIDNKLPLNVPLWDTFPVRQGHPACMLTATFLTGVDESDRRTLFNLREIPDFYMDEVFLKCLEDGEREFVTQPYRSLFYFGLHYPGRYYDADILEILPDLTVRSKVDLPLEKTTRIGFSVCVDPTFVSKENQRRWIKNRPMILMYLDEMMLGFRDYKDQMRKLLDYDAAIYSFLMSIVQNGVVDKDSEFLKELFKILSMDNLVLEHFINTLRVKYPEFYQKVNRLCPLDEYQFHKHGKASFSAPDGTRRKTILTAYVSVERK